MIALTCPAFGALVTPSFSTLASCPYCKHTLVGVADAAWSRLLAAAARDLRHEGSLAPRVLRLQEAKRAALAEVVRAEAHLDAACDEIRWLHETEPLHAWAEQARRLARLESIGRALATATPVYRELAPAPNSAVPAVAAAFEEELATWVVVTSRGPTAAGKELTEAQ